MRRRSDGRSITPESMTRLVTPDGAGGDGRVEIEFLIDTGTGMSVITEETGRRLRGSLLPHERILTDQVDIG